MPRDVEDGYTRINNEIMEALAATNLNGAEFQCIMLLLRQTYGWNRKSDAISYGQWEEGTGLPIRTVKRAVKSLLQKCIIIRDGSHYVNRWTFNKYFEKWEISVKSGTKTSVKNDTSSDETSVKNDTETSVKNDTETSVKNDTHKRKERQEIQISCIESESTYKEAESFPTPTPTKTNSRGLHKNIDPRKIDDNGIIPSGKGETPFEVYREVFNHTPGHTVIADIMQTATDLPKWRELCCEWARRGYKPANVAGLLDVYANGWRSGNGYGKPAQEQPDIDYLKRQVITGNGKGLTQEELDEIIRTSDF